MAWRILADTVMGVHLLLIGLFLLYVLLLVFGFFKERRGWRLVHYGVMASVGYVGVVSWTEMPCPLTELEYALRRLYDPSESWLRTRSLLGTFVLDTTGVEVPEFAFTIALGVGIGAMIGSVVARRA